MVGGRNAATALFAVIVGAVCGHSLAIAADVVYVAAPKARDGREKITGEVIEYTGRELVIKRPNGRERKVPGQNVLEIQSEWLPDHAAADERRRERDFASAGESYERALKEEDRAWVRRRILAGLIDCLNQQGRFDTAGKFFLALVHEDPDTPYFAMLPLGWQTAEPSPALERLAREWLASDADPVAVLMGASHLLPTGARDHALAALERLTNEKDPRISSLAEAQSWRAQVATVKAERAKRWQERLDRVPAPLRAGPTLIVGKALARLGDHEAAAIALMRIPIVHPDEIALASEALWLAGRSLESISQVREAETAYRELVEKYPDTPYAAEAQARPKIERE